MKIISVLYLLLFALSGVMISRFVFHCDKKLKRIFFGLAFGLVMLIWFPVLFAFVFSSFNLMAQILAAVLAVLLGSIFFILTEKQIRNGKIKLNIAKSNLKPFLLTVIPLTAIGFILHINHTIVPASDGSLHVGQCTYGDLCMHLGFISSISVQQTFPPDYSLLPGTQLCYPFLCDSVSSTFYTLGSSLRFATILPALYAYLVVVLGLYFFFEQWFKKDSVAVFGTYLFLIGGGLGFAYVFNNRLLLLEDGVDRWEQLMEGFYITPTNSPGDGMRWVNAIADMLLPQRATLFGWALLFPCLNLLNRAAIDKEYKFFIPLGVIAGALPLIHTHSFLAVALMSIFLFVSVMRKQIHKFLEKDSLCAHADVFGLLLLCSAVALIGKFISKAGDEQFGAIFVFVFTISEALLLIIMMLKNKSIFKSYSVGFILLVSCACLLGLVNSLNSISYVGIIASIMCTALYLVMLVVYLIKVGMLKNINVRDYITKDDDGKYLSFFVIFGLISVVLAVPQVFGFTLKQASTDMFTRWQFNWCNVSDTFLWFYIKNMGLIFLFMFPAFFMADKDKRLFFGGGLLIWFICEFVVFQPNTYDNNKLLFVWFALMCGLVADYFIKMYKKMIKPDSDDSASDSGRKTSVRIVAALVIVALFLSGALTLAREYVSADHIGFSENENGQLSLDVIEGGYQLVNADEVKLAEWICDNTESDDIFLTHNNHNNAIAMLTGRSIFVGSGTFLHWHGVDYTPREVLLKSMYESPESCLMDYASEFDLTYVRIGRWEKGNYNVDTSWFDNNLELVFQSGGEKLYKIK